MRIPIRFKMFALVAVILIMAIGAVLWKTSEIFQQDKSLFVREFADRFTGTVARLASDRIQSLQNNIAVIVSSRESLSSLKQGSDLGKIIFERFPDFLAVALIDKSNGKWVPKWIEKNPLSSAKSWPENYENTLVRSINFDAASEGGIFLSRLSQPSGVPSYGVSYVADLQAAGGTSAKSMLVGIVAPSAFEDIIIDFKGDINEVFMVDQRGFVYAHPNPKFMGANLESHPLVADLKQLKREGAVGEYTDMDGEPIIGSYRKVKGTNLFVASSTPTKEAFRAAASLGRNVLMFGIGFVIIGLVFALFVAKRITNPLNRLKELAAQIGSGDFKVQVDVSSTDEVGELAKSIDQMKLSLLEREEKLEQSKVMLVQSEKMSAFGQLSAGIAHEVKNPLAGILGHAQLAKNKAGANEDLKKHIDVIEKETRRTKEIIENLMKFARAEKAELVPTNLYDCCSATVDLVEHQLNLMGVRIIKKLTPVPLVNANSNQLQQVFLNIMMNAGHAMEKSDEKELTIYLEQVDKIARIRIQDTGTGMTPEVQKRIFEPFFTTKPAGKGTGLGLSVSIGIIRDHHSKVYVESQVGKGSTFFIDIPIPEGNKQVAQPTHEDKNAHVIQPPPVPTARPIESAPESIPEKPMVAARPTPPPPPPPVEVSKPYSPPMPDIQPKTLVDKVIPPALESETKTSVPRSPFGSLPKPPSSPSAAAVTPITQSPVEEAPKTLGGKEAVRGVGPEFPASPGESAPTPPPPPTTKPPEIATASASVPPPPPEENELGYAAPTPPATKPLEAPAPEVAATAAPPPAPATKEPGYDEQLPAAAEGDDFKVTIRRPKLKV